MTDDTATAVWQRQPRLHFRTGEVNQARQLVENYHYSEAWPATAHIVGTWHIDGGLFGDSGPAVAACVFGNGARGWNEPVLELVRLVRDPAYNVQLSGLIALTCKHCKHKGHELLISYADVRQNHHGGIYQAASWNYSGPTKRDVDIVIIDGRKYHRRTANSVFGTSSRTKLRQLGHQVVDVVDPGKHFYWRAMSKEALKRAERLGFQSLPYPKPHQVEVI